MTRCAARLTASGWRGRKCSSAGGNELVIGESSVAWGSPGPALLGKHAVAGVKVSGFLLCPQYGGQKGSNSTNSGVIPFGTGPGEPAGFLSACAWQRLRL